MIILTRNDDGTCTEPLQDIAWTRTSYTEPRESLDDCTDCGKPIGEWDLFLCLDDGSESAHVSCVTILEPLPAAQARITQLEAKLAAARSAEHDVRSAYLKAYEHTADTAGELRRMREWAASITTPEQEG